MSLRVALLLSAVAALLACGEPPKKKEFEPTSSQRDEVIGVLDGEEITREKLYWFVSASTIEGLSKEDVFTRPLSDTGDLVRELAATRVGARRALAPDSGVDPEKIEEATRERDSILTAHLIEKEILAGQPPLRDAEIREFYERNQAAFTTPFRFSMRLIFVSNYAPVTAKEGDTLASLAETISGSADAIDAILTDAANKPFRAPGYSRGNRVPIKSLEPGERLLVPLSPEGRQTSRAKIEEAKRRLDNGEDFVTVAREVSESESKGGLIDGVGLTGKVVLPEILAVARKTPPGRISDVFETVHGYYIVKVEEKHEEEIQPLDEVRQEVIRQLTHEKNRRTMDRYTEALFDMPDLKINVDLLCDPQCPEEAVVVTLGDREFRRNDLLIAQMERPSTRMPKEDVMAALFASRDLRKALALHKARQLGIHETDYCRFTVDGKVNRRLKNAYLDAVKARIPQKELTEEESQRFFEENQETFRLAPAYSYYVLALRIPDGDSASDQEGTPAPSVDPAQETLRRLEALVDYVKDLEAFKKLIAQHSDDPSSRATEGLVENAPEKIIDPMLINTLRSLNPGQMSRPVRTKEYAVAVWLVHKSPSRLPTYAEVKEAVLPFYRKKLMDNFPNDTIAEMLQEVDLVLP
ncbi:MAG TPA: peptidyl-prolyl cis-trans isomerase [Sumerlaeia bacterium]|nr:peptidyl-prolyl cis-trans isomerase [Sumerlaeia bacterium]